MEIKLSRLNAAFALQAENEDGQKIQIDASQEIGGTGIGMRPMEILVSSLASCASIDVLLILKKKRIALEFYEVYISATRKNEVSAVFESIHLNFSIGKNDPLETVVNAVKMSLDTYCSVAAMLKQNCEITFEVNERMK